MVRSVDLGHVEHGRAAGTGGSWPGGRRRRPARAALTTRATSWSGHVRPRPSGPPAPPPATATMLRPWRELIRSQVSTTHTTSRTSHHGAGGELGQVGPAAGRRPRSPVVEDDPDRLAEAHGGDAEVVALQVEGELADEHGQDGRHQAPGQDGRGKGDRGRQAQARGDDGGDVGADGHEAAVAEREQPGEAGQDGQAQDRDQVDADEDGDALDVFHAGLLGLVLGVPAHDPRGRGRRASR